jgi:protein gp37
VADHGTAIGWTHIPGYKGETWNPVTGCDRVSPGCAHCYALELASRLKRMGQPRYQKDGDPKTSGPGFGLTLHPDKLKDPLRWKKPRCVFVNSMSDLFHEEIPDEFVADVFGVMANAPQHRFLVLTKRPERMRDLLCSYRFHKLVGQAISTTVAPEPANGWATIAWEDDDFLDNVWLGVTIENRRFVDRADLLRETPARIRFISAEPLLGPLMERESCSTCWDWDDPDCEDCEGLGWWWSQNSLNLDQIDWVITGGESGPKHRRFDPEWALDLREACDGGGVAFFHKQNGGPKPTSYGRLLNGHTYDEFPAVAS